MDSKYLKVMELVPFCIQAHTDSAKEPKKAVRKWDGKTPYAIHPIWCGMMILTEERLPDELRIIGAMALLLHDVLEDTTAGLPEDLAPEVVRLVEEMTFENSRAEMDLIWSRRIEVLLLKLYDKYNNLLDSYWMTPEKYQEYKRYLLRLCKKVEECFGTLNIIRMARALPDR